MHSGNFRVKFAAIWLAIKFSTSYNFNFSGVESHSNAVGEQDVQTRGRGTGSRGPGVWKTRGLAENAGYHFFRQNMNFPQ